MLSKLKFIKPKFIIIPLLALILLISTLLGSAYFLTPSNFQAPRSDHSHFRMQYVFLGQLEDFGSPRYQVDYLKDVCDGRLAESPIHFHDNRNQFVHLHWQRVTGGQVLKFYGLNEIGGLNDFMGLKLDDLLKFKFTQIPIHSDSLPKPRPQDRFWVYSGDQNSYQKREFKDFVNQDLETFFGTKSRVREQAEEAERFEKQINFNPLAIPAQAHAGEVHKTLTEAEQHEADTKKEAKERAEIERKNNGNNIATTEQERQSSVANLASSSVSNSNPNSSSSSSPTNSTSSETGKSEEELKQINNLLGNVVIFVQPDEPKPEQVKARFDNLIPLGLSVCGG